MNLDWATLSTPVIIAIVPILVALFKKIAPAESHKWLYPVMASAFGAALTAIDGALGNVGMTPLYGVLLGMAGVALREVIDQVKKTATGV